MDDHTLRSQLRSLGIDEGTWRVVTLLPLVEVAWADGAVQPAERARILHMADASKALEGDGRLVLEGWLSYRPSPAYFQRGRDALRGLLDRPEAAHIQIDDILSACEAVARAAGGLFGVVGAIDTDERNLLAEIADELPRYGSWQGMMGRLDDAFEEWDDDDPTELFVGEVTTESVAPVEPDVKTEGPHLLVHDALYARRVALAGTATLGRGADNTIVVRTDARLSRRHCTFYTQDGRWYVVDSGSVNGTHVQGERVLERRLFGGEQLVLGTTRVSFHL